MNKGQLFRRLITHPISTTNSIINGYKARQALLAGNKQLELEHRLLAFRNNIDDYESSARCLALLRVLKENGIFKTRFEEFTKKQPNNAELWVERGKFHIKHPDLAIKDFDMALSLDPNSVPAKTEIIQHLHKKGEDDRVAQITSSLSKDIQLTNPAALKLLGRSYALSGNWEKFDAILKQVNKDKYKPIYDRLLGEKRIIFIRKAMQEMDSYGNLLPITIKDRGTFLRSPRTFSEQFHNDDFYGELDQIKSSTKRGKRKTGNNLLFITHSNWNFMEGITKHFQQVADINVDSIEFCDFPADLADNYVDFTGKLGTKAISELWVPSFATKTITWADRIYCEWCNYPAVWLSHILPTDQKLIVRLHSYEAFTIWPHLVNWSRVDHLIYVAEHIKRFHFEMEEIEKWGVKTTVVPNYNDISIFDLPKHKMATKKLALIGYNTANKGLKLALNILNALVQQEPDWKLRLVGSPIPEEHKFQSEEKYFENCMAFISENKLDKSIEYVGFTNEIEKEFQNIGFILSCSEREGTHETVVQGMASGAIPVVYNWPMVAKWGAASAQFGSKWVFNDVEEAIALIDETRVNFETNSTEAKAYAQTNFSTEVVTEKLEKIILED